MSNPGLPTEPAPGKDELDPAHLLERALRTVKPSIESQPWTPPAAEEVARLLPQYGIESLLGRGGMGAVYRGTQPGLDRPVAIKLLPAELAADEDFTARFRREAQTLARLQHPGIVAIHDFGQTSEGHLYFVMELVDGTDLQTVLREPGITPSQSLELISQICTALHYAHSQGVIHRDIKPLNILLTKDGRAKLGDFGLARPLTPETAPLTGKNVVMGTLDYMAPEQRAGQADQRTDIYALGIMLYEMLTGQRPHGAFDPPSTKPDVDFRLDEVVLKAMRQEPERRYQQVDEMKTDVDHIRSTTRLITPPPRRRRFLVAVVLVLALAAAGMALRERLKNPPSPTPAATGVASDLSTSTPEQRFADQRKLAKSVLSNHGSVIVWREGRPLQIEHIEKLPPGPITLHHVDQVTGDFSDNDAALLGSCQELKTLRLHRCSNTFLPIDSLPALENLEVGGSYLTTDGLRGLAGHQNLYRVLIAKSPIDGKVTGLLAKCPNLANLIMNRIGLKDGDLEALARLPRLRDLWIVEEAMTEKGLVTLASFPALENLGLGEMDLDAATLDFLPRMKSLVKITFDHCALPSDICGTLARLPKLNSLSFRVSRITDEMLPALSSLTQLRSLDLRETAVTDASIPTIITFRSLKELDIRNTAITKEGAAALRQALPNCDVQY